MFLKNQISIECFTLDLSQKVEKWSIKYFNENNIISYHIILYYILVDGAIIDWIKAWWYEISETDLISLSLNNFSIKSAWVQMFKCS
jgi:hypothetical protein